MGALEIQGGCKTAKTAVVALTCGQSAYWAPGDILYFDDTSHWLTKASGGGRHRVGIATAIATNPSAIGEIRLDGHCGAAQ